MLANIVRIAGRHLVRRKAYTLLNVFGLSLCVASLLVIGLYVNHELSFEGAHEKRERVFRIVVDRLYEEGRVRSLAPTSPPLADAVRRNVPEVEQVARLFVPTYTTGRVALRRGAKAMYEERFFYADPSVFEVFSVPLQKGHAATALQRPQSVILSESMAKKYFPSGDPLGRTLTLDDSVTVEVTAVMADWPSASHLQPDFIAPYALLERQYGNRAASWWGWDLVYTYVLLREADARPIVTQKIQGVLDEAAAPRTSRRGYTYAATLQPLADIHLYSHREWEMSAGGDPTYLKALTVIAIFVLVLGCINFVNLSTVTAAARSREIGVRKVLGSSRRRLILQFLSESTLLAAGAVLLGVVLAVAVLPIASELASAELRLTPSLLPALLALIFALGIAAGGYPAFYLASLRPTASLTGWTPTGGRARRLLIVAQFTISLTLSTGALLMYQQIEYLQARELGFDDEQVLVVTMGSGQQHLDALKQSLLSRPGIERVTATSGVPGKKTELMQISAEGHQDQVPVQMLWVDEDFVETLGLEIVEGRGFDAAIGSDASHAYIINKTAAEMLGWADPLGKEISWTSGWGTKKGEVIGVVDDFHLTSLREHVQPLVLTITPAYGYLAIRTEAQGLRGLMDDLEVWWQDTAPGKPFEYAFLDDIFGRLYERERTQAAIFGAFAALAVLIACMGLFGLAAYTAEARTREVGIRKVMGATVVQIYTLLSASYARLVVVALFAAVPITYIIMDRWLDGFANRITIHPAVFAAVGGGMLLIALAAVGYQSLRAALADPVDTLRSE